MMAVILRGQAFPGQLFTKVGKYDDVEPRSVLVAGHAAAVPHGKRDGRGTPLPHRGIR
jgi:hypothetical protein